MVRLFRSPLANATMANALTGYPVHLDWYVLHLLGNPYGNLSFCWFPPNSSTTPLSWFNASPFRQWITNSNGAHQPLTTLLAHQVSRLEEDSIIETPSRSESKENPPTLNTSNICCDKRAHFTNRLCSSTVWFRPRVALV